MSTTADPPPASSASPANGAPPLRRRVLRWLPWVSLVALLGVAQSLLVGLAISHEESRAQERADEAANEVAVEMRRRVQASLQSAQALTWGDPPLVQWQYDALAMLRQRNEFLRLELRDEAMAVLGGVDTPFRPALFGSLARGSLEADTLAACAAARRLAAPTFSRTFFVPLPGGLGQEVIDLCLPLDQTGQPTGYMVATLSLREVLEESMRSAGVAAHELSLVEADGTRLLRAGSRRGAGVYQAMRIVDLPGQSLQLRADATQGRPGLIPNLTVALVLGLSLLLFGLVLLLVRDVRRRARAETALAEALAFRRAMEDSLVTGLRARDVHGRITYVNPAFCQMVGWNAQELIGTDPPPYWPPERIEEYRQRQAERLTLAQDPAAQREGFETLFMRRGGERFPVMIYEAPLLDRVGHHAGWMSAVLDVSATRRMEEMARQQQERLQATARLATVGEMASLLSHELNQPLAAIASYASGSLNLMEDARGPVTDDTPALLRQALERIAEQAERAGRVIKSVHGFVRRREQAREAVAADALVEAVAPLVRLQARKSGTRIEIDIAQPAPRLWVDRTMIEQVLLNLTRNAVQAMESAATPLDLRVLRLQVDAAQGRWVQLRVADRGEGIPPTVAAQLFTPFFTTRAEGMGLGLSLCRTVIEQHGGAMDFGPARPDDAQHPGTEFRFTLPLAPATGTHSGNAPSAGPDAATHAVPGDTTPLRP